jgi:PhzF family phenazine biosynthesis protein
MRAPMFQVDAFANHRFGGNPAAVVVLDAYPADATMQAIAAENNLAETAFLVAEGEEFRLRWFTPVLEVPLCGHATLASAAVVMERLRSDRRQVVFHSKSGPLPVRRTQNGYAMDFPGRPSAPVTAASEVIDALGAHPDEVLVNEFNYMAVFDSEKKVRELSPDMAAIARLDRPGTIVTGPGDGRYDFVSRYFAPAKGIPEDPVTGAAHCMLTPYWAKRLGRTSFTAYQASRRGGQVHCRLLGDRVELEGGCVFFFEGEIEF